MLPHTLSLSLSLSLSRSHSLPFSVRKDLRLDRARNLVGGRPRPPRLRAMIVEIGLALAFASGVGCGLGLARYLWGPKTTTIVLAPPPEPATATPTTVTTPPELATTTPTTLPPSPVRTRTRDAAKHIDAHPGAADAPAAADDDHRPYSPPVVLVCRHSKVYHTSQFCKYLTSSTVPMRECKFCFRSR